MLFLANVGRISLTRNEFVVPPEDEDNNDVNLVDPLNNFAIALRGTATWFQVQLDELAEYHEILLEAFFDYKATREKPQEYRDRGRIGIWTATKDVSISTDVSSTGNTYDHGDVQGIQLLLNEWNFGKRSKISFKIQKIDQDSRIQLAVCAIPFFHVEKQPHTELTLKLSGMKEVGGIYETVMKKHVTFKLDRDVTPTPPSRKEIEFLQDLGAFNLDGAGNSVHPKQLFTTRTLKKQLERAKNPVKLAYIGTDTTENLRSLIRLIKTQVQLTEKVDSLDIYYTEEWDEQIMGQYPGLEFDESCAGDFELNLKKLPMDGTLPENVHSVDFVLSTYVTPWAMADNQNKTQYMDLVKKLLGAPSSRLISVDPSTSIKAIRSTCKYFTLQDMYKEELGLQLVKSEHAGNDMVVDCKIWRPKSAEV